MIYTPPERIQPTHDVETFDCGQPTLDNWLRKRALENEKPGASRTYVVCYEKKVVGYYSLATGSVVHADAVSKIRRNMPDPIPVMVLGRLAVDINHQGKGIGKGLIKDAVMRTLQASEIAGIRAILVHALDEEAKKYYVEQCGFMSSPIHPLTLMVTLADVQKSL
jgi:predicted N-acetyltransferase YhbS